ncbi:hypothetical protein HZS_3794 [Henneguya salminicola]|nr:hypothetical protein HZS_3794 [Henneguya salminicola]
MEKAKSTQEKDIYLLDDHAYRFYYILKDETTKVYRCTNQELVTPPNFCVPTPSKQSTIKLCSRVKEAAENLYVTPCKSFLALNQL